MRVRVQNDGWRYSRTKGSSFNFSADGVGLDGGGGCFKLIKYSPLGATARYQAFCDRITQSDDRTCNRRQFPTLTTFYRLKFLFSSLENTKVSRCAVTYAVHIRLVSFPPHFFRTQPTMTIKVRLRFVSNDEQTSNRQINKCVHSIKNIVCAIVVHI